MYQISTSYDLKDVVELVYGASFVVRKNTASPLEKENEEPQAGKTSKDDKSEKGEKKERCMAGSTDNAEALC